MTTGIDMPEFRALIVDDDPIARRTVSFALRHEGFSCDSASDGEEALALMRVTQYDLLVTDLRMPHKHGHSLALDVLAGQTPPKIIVHTSVEDPRLTKDLIVRGVEDVIYKPANYAAFAAKAMGIVLRHKQSHENEQGRETAAEESHHEDSEAANKTQTFRHSPVSLAEMKSRLANISKVQPISHAALDIANMVCSSSFNAEQVAAAIQRDPAISAKVLQLANNPFYNPTGKQIMEVRQAVILIGQQRVGELVLAMSALATVTPESLPWMDLDLAWRRCMAAGIAVELLIKQGHHGDISEGLLFSALMHLSGRAVLGTHYPDRYEALVKRCIENDEVLVDHEASTFPEDHAEVMCDLLADWNISCEMFQPLKYALKDNAAISSLSEPMRTRVELVKLAILIGQIAVGSWETWDRIEFPRCQMLQRLRIDDVGMIIAQTEAQLPGIADFRIGSPPAPANHDHPEPANRTMAYFDLSQESFDFLPEVIPSMGIRLYPVTLHDIGTLRHNALVNRIGNQPGPSMEWISSSGKCCEPVFVGDDDRMTDASSIGTNIVLPCSYAALRSACYAATEISRDDL